MIMIRNIVFFNLFLDLGYSRKELPQSIRICTSTGIMDLKSDDSLFQQMKGYTKEKA